MPARFNVLATYNGERSRGVAHTPEWDAQMAALQQEFHDWERGELTRRFGPEVAPGTWICRVRSPLRKRIWPLAGRRTASQQD